MGPASRFACAGRRRWISDWSAKATTTAVARHCERSDAIHGTSGTKLDCFAALAMTGVVMSGKHLGRHSGMRLGAAPESITTDGGYGFWARCCASPRACPDDPRSWVRQKWGRGCPGQARVRRQLCLARMHSESDAHAAFGCRDAALVGHRHCLDGTKYGDVPGGVIIEAAAEHRADAARAPWCGEG